MSGKKHYELSPTTTSPSEYLFAHAVNPNRGGYDALIEKITGKDQRHVNSTMIAPGVNTYSNTDWRGYPMVIFRNPIFLAGYPTDIGSDGYFLPSGSKKEATSPVFCMFDISEWNKNKLNPVSAWGDFSVRMMRSKVEEVSHRIKDPTQDFSSEEYFNKNGEKIIPSRQRYSDAVYRKFRDQEIPVGEQRHNECHLKAGLQHVAGIAITQEFFDKSPEEKGEVLKYNVIASKAVAMLAAKTLQEKIAGELSAKRGRDDEPSEKTSHMAQLEIDNVQYLLEKIFMAQQMLTKLELQTTPETNNTMRLAFASKQKKFPDFDPSNPQNLEIWLRSNKAYFQALIEDLSAELGNIPDELRVGTETLLKKSSVPEFIAATKQWRSEIAPETITKLEENSAKKLSRNLPFQCYNKSDGSLSEIVISDNDLRLNPNDDSLILQLTTYGLLETKEAQELLFQLTPERKSIMLEFSLPGNNRQAKHIAAKIGSVESLKILARLGDDLKSKNDETIAEVAAENGNVETLKFLRDEVGIDLYERYRFGHKLFFLAIQWGKAEAVNFLLRDQDVREDHFNPDSAAYAAAQYAAYRGDDSMLALVSSKGFNMHRPSDYGNITPMLFLAAFADKPEQMLEKYFGFKTDGSKQSPFLQVLTSTNSREHFDIATHPQPSIKEMLLMWDVLSKPKAFLDLISALRIRDNNCPTPSLANFRYRRNQHNIIEILAMDGRTKILDVLTNVMTGKDPTQQENAQYLQKTIVKLFEIDPDFVSRLPEGNTKKFLQSQASTLVHPLSANQLAAQQRVTDR